jgi:glutamate synthase domain-containing protein 2
MDSVGLPLQRALPIVLDILNEYDALSHAKLLAAGKLINPSRQIAAMARGADAVYSARGFLLALGCIQALQCNKNTCPVGLTTHDPKLTRGLDIEMKSERVANYVRALEKEHGELLAALGCRSHRQLGPQVLGSALALEDSWRSSEGMVPARRLVTVQQGVGA